MGTSIGYKAIMGAAKETTYSTAVAPTDAVPLLTEGIEFNYEQKLYDWLQGSAGISGSKRTFKGVSGALEAEVLYTVKSGAAFVSSDLLIALAMGTATWDAGQGSNRITLLDDLNVFGTLAWDKDVHATAPWEATSCLVNQMVLSASEKEGLKISLDLMIEALAYQGGTVTVSNLAALPTDVAPPVLFKDFVFQIGDHAGALDANDKTAISEFSLTLNNNLGGYQQATPDQTNQLSYNHTDALIPILPGRDGLREVLFEFVIPRYAADTFQVYLANDTDLQALLLGTDPASSEEFDIIIPNLKVESIAAPVEGPGLVTQTVTCRCFKRNSTSDVKFSDASTTDVGEVWIETDNSRTAAIF